MVDGLAVVVVVVADAPIDEPGCPNSEQLQMRIPKRPVVQTAEEEGKLALLAYIFVANGEKRIH